MSSQYWLHLKLFKLSSRESVQVSRVEVSATGCVDGDSAKWTGLMDPLVVFPEPSVFHVTDPVTILMKQWECTESTEPHKLLSLAYLDCGQITDSSWKEFHVQMDSWLGSPAGVLRCQAYIQRQPYSFGAPVPGLSPAPATAASAALAVSAVSAVSAGQAFYMRQEDGFTFPSASAPPADPAPAVLEPQRQPHPTQAYQQWHPPTEAAPAAMAADAQPAQATVSLQQQPAQPLAQPAGFWASQVAAGDPAASGGRPDPLEQPAQPLPPLQQPALRFKAPPTINDPWVLQQQHSCSSQPLQQPVQPLQPLLRPPPPAGSQGQAQPVSCPPPQSAPQRKAPPPPPPELRGMPENISQLGITFYQAFHPDQTLQGCAELLYHKFANGKIPETLYNPAPPANMSWLLCDLQTLEPTQDFYHDVPLEQRAKAATLVAKLLELSSRADRTWARAPWLAEAPWQPPLLTWLRNVAAGKVSYPNYLAHAAASGVTKFRYTDAGEKEHLVPISSDGQIVPHMQHVNLVLASSSAFWQAPLVWQVPLFGSTTF